MEIKITEFNPNEVVRIMRDTTGLSQTEFGKSINRGRDSISNIERGTNNVFFKTIIEIAKEHNLELILRDNNICNKQKSIL